ncbi:MAG TPA: hypothetical protein VGL39_13510 [Jatrophihabitantaceae bacterium]|jgi:hypothetical protein
MQNEPPTQVAAAADTADVQAIVTLPHVLNTPVAPGERACCCPSLPANRVVLPPTPPRDHAVDLLLCGHHYRASRAALTRAGAHVFDAAGVLIYSPGVVVEDTARPHNPAR